MPLNIIDRVAQCFLSWSVGSVVFGYLGSRSGSVKDKPWFLVFCDFSVTCFQWRLMLMYRYLPYYSKKYAKTYFFGISKPLPKREGSRSVIHCTDPRIRISVKMSRSGTLLLRLQICVWIRSGINMDIGSGSGFGTRFETIEGQNKPQKRKKNEELPCF